MENATHWEVAWSSIFFLGTAFGLILVGYLGARLARRYQRKRNGGGRLLAWKDVVLVGLLTGNAALGLALGFVAVAAPPAGRVPTGPVEQWALLWLSAYSVPALVIKGALLVGALASVLVFEMKIDHYLRVAGDPDGAEHPDLVAQAAAALEIAAAARAAADDVAAAAKRAADDVARAAAVAAAQVALAAERAERLAAAIKAAPMIEVKAALDVKAAAEVATAAAVNTAALMDNTAALHENTQAQEGGHTQEEKN